MTERPRCEAVVYKRDTYRVSRGAKSGFKMHYDRCQCSRKAVTEDGLCRQHGSMIGYVARVKP